MGHKTIPGRFLNQPENSAEEVVVCSGPADIDNGRVLELVIKKADAFGMYPYAVASTPLCCD